MASQRVIDLDALVGAPITVRLGGREYKLPADCPAPLYLKILHFAEVGQTDDGVDPAVVQSLYDEVLALFQIHQPELERLPIGLNLLVDSIGAIYGSDGEAEPDPEPDPTTPAGTRSSSSRKKTSSRSSRSSAS